MKKIEINIEGTTYPIKFGYGAFRIMGRKWGCKGINETMQKLSILDSLGADLTFEQEDVISDIVLAGIALAQPEIDLPHQDQIMDALLKDMQVLSDITTGLLESLPVQKAEPSKKKKEKPNQK